MLSERVRTALRTVERYVRPRTRAIASTSSSSPSPPTVPLDSETERAYASKIIHGRSRFPPYFHPKTHGIPVAILHVRSHFKELADLYMHFASHAASALGIPASHPAHLPTQRSLWTVPKSPFVHKKSQENFERKVHKRAMKLWDSDERVVSRWLQYLQMYPLPGVGMRVVRWHRAPIGVGKTHDEGKSERELESRRLENVTDRQRVEEVAARIIKQELKSAKLNDVPTTTKTVKKTTKSS